MPQHLKSVCGQEFAVMPGVYDTGVDTELMADVVRINRRERFLEVGCGCGAVSLLLASRSGKGVGVDINPAAIQAAKRNQDHLGITNVEFTVGDVFDNVTGRFDVIVCNPPYNCHDARDPIERMFWDPQDVMKRAFFRNVGLYLRPNGRVYFGWANFPDLDPDLPFSLAHSAGLRYIQHYERLSGKGIHRFFVIEFRAKSGIASLDSESSNTESLLKADVVDKGSGCW